MEITFREWESKSALEASLLSDPPVWITLGKEAESLRRFYSFEVGEEGTLTGGIAVFSSGLGVKPTMAVFPDGSVFSVLYDSSISFVRNEPIALLATSTLEGVGFQLVPETSRDLMVVVHELGVVAFAKSGEKVWSVTALDIVEDWKRIEGNLLVFVSAGRSELIDLSSGTIIPES